MRIDTEQDLAQGVASLLAIEPRFGRALAGGPLPLRRKAEGFGTLLQAIIGQQVSTASAASIWARLEEAGLIQEATVAAADPEALRACGLSRPKMRYAHSLAAARLDYAALREATTDGVIATLTAVPGIGRWTAEIYALVALGHADVFAAGDLALQEGARLLFDLPARPDERTMRILAANWSPQRAVAARALWAYYRSVTKREGAL